ncbi:acyl-CoA N-acyltransferase [Collybia nuda]|uniref:N-alpha-acetyltransferase 40 n=1 Tax=Collybia nuda TaxID=64659 RepID=A0A9P5Y1X9_9AGAR|nr:acyl-CoA N-acyltransferase [Collybia nuda]
MELDEHQRKNIWDIFEGNMHHLYKGSSFGWDPQSKIAELFAPLSRFILVHVQGRLIAFVAFRFEYEHDGNTIYCYDLQVLSSYQRSGLGRALVLGLETLGRAWEMVKITLTVFKANASACRFYENMGFQIDVASPGYVPIGEVWRGNQVDYEILSKNLN